MISATFAPGSSAHIINSVYTVMKGLAHTRRPQRQGDSSVLSVVYHHHSSLRGSNASDALTVQPFQEKIDFRHSIWPAKAINENEKLPFRRKYRMNEYMLEVGAPEVEIKLIQFWTQQITCAYFCSKKCDVGGNELNDERDVEERSVSSARGCARQARKRNDSRDTDCYLFNRR